MIENGFGAISQIAWVAQDLERSIAGFRDIYGVPDFWRAEVEMKARVGTRHGTIRLSLGLANVDGMELELIQAHDGELADFYRDVLTRSGAANAFHHVCVKVRGTQSDWDAHLEKLHGARKPVYYEGETSPGIRFCYTDERAFLGHYVEHVWLSDEVQQRLDGIIPHYTTRSGDLAAKLRMQPPTA